MRQSSCRWLMGVAFVGLLIGPGVIHAAAAEPSQEATPSEGAVAATHPTYLQEGTP
jgi:hypothetical protein